MEALPARRTDGASGLSGRAAPGAASHSRLPGGQGAWERPGALPGRSQNVGRSLGIEGVRALARALSLSCASQALAYVSVLQSVAFSIFANTVCAAKRPPLQRFAAFERRNRASVVLRGQHSADIMLLEEKKELVAKSTRGVPDFLRRASCSGISPHSALTLQLFVAASKLLQSDTGTRELMS